MFVLSPKVSKFLLYKTFVELSNVVDKPLKVKLTFVYALRSLQQCFIVCSERNAILLAF